MADEKPVQEIATDNTVVINGTAFERKADIKDMPVKLLKDIGFIFEVAQKSLKEGDAAFLSIITEIDKFERAFTALCVFTIGQENFKKAIPSFDDLSLPQIVEIMKQFLKK